MEPPLSDTFAISIQVPSAEDKVTARSWKALAGSVIGYCMDGFDMLILGFMLATISSDLALTNSQAGSLVTWTLVGAVAGGVLFGSLSDHFGRIRILTYTILIFAVFTFLCAFARGYWDLVVYRVIAGLGLGGEFGIGMALAAEAWPASRRARVSSYVSLGWQSGVLLSALITPILLPVIGWRGMFMVGLLPAFVAFVVRRTLDEPEIFVRKHAVKNENSFRLLVKDRKTFRTTLGIALVCAVQNFSYYGIMIWMPSYLGKSLGFSLTKSGRVDVRDSSGHGLGNTDVRSTRRPDRTQTRFCPLFGCCVLYGLPVFASHGSDRAALGRRHHGIFCKPYGRRRRALVGSISNGSPCNSTKSFVQSRSGGRSSRAPRGRCPRG